MAEKKNTTFDRPGGYAMPKGATQVQRLSAKAMSEAEIKLFGDTLPPHEPVLACAKSRRAATPGLKPDFKAADPDTRLYVGDCRDVLANLPDKGNVDLVFADPPFNWDVPYESWKDGMPRAEYERFTFDWLDGCIDVLAPHGSLWVNIPDDTVAETVLHLKRRGLTMINWCVWHFRFGQNRSSSFIMSKVHVLYFARNPDDRIWNPNEILELSDRASIYFDPRTMAKDENKGLRVPMDVWYGKYWGRIQGNNKERRHNHHNQIPEVYLERVIKACSNAGSLVLDPFCGSGTTSTVACELERRSITIEHSPVNAKSAWERIAKVGMVKRADEGPQSTAIFKSRKLAQAFQNRSKIALPPYSFNGTTAMTKLRLSDADKGIVADLYSSATRTVDDLPYTDEFEKMYVAFVARSGRELSRHDFWRALSSARKASKLVRKER